MIPVMLHRNTEANLGNRACFFLKNMSLETLQILFTLEGSVCFPWNQKTDFEGPAVLHYFSSVAF